MSDRESLREVLFRHSDSRACRLVWQTLGDGPPSAEPEPADYVEASRVTDGEVCLVAGEDTADFYLRWNGSAGTYTYVAFWPPWGVVDAGTADRATATRLLADRDDPRPVDFDETPFAGGGPAADLSGLR